jgi:hypothetical protein
LVYILFQFNMLAYKIYKSGFFNLSKYKMMRKTISYKQKFVYSIKNIL